MRTLLILSLLLVPAMWASPALAGDIQAQKGTVVSLSATSEAVVANDEVVVHYRIEATGANPNALQRKVNAVAGRVDKVLNAQNGLKRQTTGRRLQPVSHYDKTRAQQVHDGWRLVQSERVSSHGLDAVPAWVDAIEKAGAHLDGLDFKVSKQATDAAMQTLRSQAVARFRQQAAVLARSLNAPSFSILRLNTVGRPPVVPMRRGVMALSAQRGEPELNAGESRLQLNVSGEILLPEHRYQVK